MSIAALLQKIEFQQEQLKEIDADIKNRLIGDDGK
jgi:hypothetical protein